MIYIYIYSMDYVSTSLHLCIYNIYKHICYSIFYYIILYYLILYYITLYICKPPPPYTHTPAHTFWEK